MAKSLIEDTDIRADTPLKNYQLRAVFIKMEASQQENASPLTDGVLQPIDERKQNQMSLKMKPIGVSEVWLQLQVEI